MTATGSGKSMGYSRARRCILFDRVEASLAAGVRRHVLEIPEGHERRHRLPRALDDDLLTGGGLVQDRPEALPKLQGGHGLHGTIIAL